MVKTIERVLSEVEAHFGATVAREMCLSIIDGRVSRFAVPSSKISFLSDLATSLGMSLWESEKTQVPKPDIGKGGYSNQCYATFDREHPLVHRLVYFAQNLVDAKVAAEHEIAGESSKVAESLRYPRCCSLFYITHCEIASAIHQGDLFPLTVLASQAAAEAPSILNFAANYFGGSWCSFFPCNLYCAEAILRISYERARVKQIAPELADRIDRQSTGAITYTEYTGVAWIPNASVSGKTIEYSPGTLHITLDPPLTNAFSNLSVGDRIKILGPEGFAILRGDQLLWEERSQGSYARLFV